MTARTECAVGRRVRLYSGLSRNLLSVAHHRSSTPTYQRRRQSLTNTGCTPPHFEGSPLGNACFGFLNQRTSAIILPAFDVDGPPFSLQQSHHASCWQQLLYYCCTVCYIYELFGSGFRRSMVWKASPLRTASYNTGFRRCRLTDTWSTPVSMVGWWRRSEAHSMAPPPPLTAYSI